MALAVAEAHRVLRQGGCLLDIHPADEPAHLEVWYAQYGVGLPEEPENLTGVKRVQIGRLENTNEEKVRDFARTNDALADALDTGFDYRGSKKFEYQFFFDNLDEFTDYLEDNEEYARASDAMLERAVLVMQQSPTPPKLVVIQNTLVSALTKA